MDNLTKLMVNLCVMVLTIIGVMTIATYAAKSQTTPEDIDKYCKYGEHVEAANRDTLKFGMPEKCVIATWGKPNKINTTLRKGLKFQQWVYYRNGVFYLYFKNGILKTAQTSSGT